MHTKIPLNSLLPRTLYYWYHILWLYFLNIFCIQMLLYCLSCLPRDTEYSISFISLPLMLLPPVLYIATRMACIMYTMDLWPLYFLSGTHPFSPFLLVYSLTHKVRPFVIWPWPTCPIFLHSSICQQSYSLSLVCFPVFFLIYMEKNHTSHHNVHFEVKSSLTEKSSLTLRINFFQLWQTHAKMASNNSCLLVSRPLCNTFLPLSSGRSSGDWYLSKRIRWRW